MKSIPIFILQLCLFCIIFVSMCYSDNQLPHFFDHGESILLIHHFDRDSKKDKKIGFDHTIKKPVSRDIDRWILNLKPNPLLSNKEDIKMSIKKIKELFKRLDDTQNQEAINKIHVNLAYEYIILYLHYQHEKFQIALRKVNQEDKAQFRYTDATLKKMEKSGIEKTTLQLLKSMKNKNYLTKHMFETEIINTVGLSKYSKIKRQLIDYAEYDLLELDTVSPVPDEELEQYIQWADYFLQRILPEPVNEKQQYTLERKNIIKKEYSASYLLERKQIYISIFF